MDTDDLRKSYIEIVASVREYMEEQLQLGFSETELREPEKKLPYADFDLPSLTADAEGCTRCALHETRNSVVFGVGDTSADLMFIGEAPGADEDQQGEPFVGRAGQLLTQIIEAGMKLKRSDVYIANILKCRPPGNRNPAPDEVETCSPYLIRQIELIQPKVIVALGSFAAQMLLGTKTGITRLRGEFHDCNVVGLNFPPHKKPPVVMPTFHPAYLLRNPNAKRDVWEDIQQVMAVLADG